MKDNAIEKKVPARFREKGQYTLVFGVIALMLYAAGFPIFLLFFVGVLTFFIWKVFSSEGRYETRRIFEFYLSANEIIREDGRRWYGFEIQETIRRGEAILQSMAAPPPLVYFALGALYQKVDDHGLAARHLSRVIEEESSGEAAIVFPTQELRDYVQMLRKIERAPAEAPLTSAAVRSLERCRKNKGKAMLEHSRSILAEHPPLQPCRPIPNSVTEKAGDHETEFGDLPRSTFEKGSDRHEGRRRTTSLVSQERRRTISPRDERKPISEVLRDIYDKNIQ